MRRVNIFFKRFIDVIGSLIGVITIFPLLLIIALLIKLSSEGPIFFKQERLGKDGNVFKIIKFRTMIINAEKIGDGLSINSSSDSRITFVGKFLRNTSLDELPQLLNVFKGDMSLVGPRPPVTYFPYEGIENYPRNAKIRFNMKPGITGLSQVLQRNNTTWDQRIVVDIKYVEEFNLILDLKILIKTVFKLFNSSDVYSHK